MAISLSNEQLITLKNQIITSIIIDVKNEISSSTFFDLAKINEELIKCNFTSLDHYLHTLTQASDFSKLLNTGKAYDLQFNLPDKTYSTKDIDADVSIMLENIVNKINLRILDFFTSLINSQASPEIKEIINEKASQMMDYFKEFQKFEEVKNTFDKFQKPLSPFKSSTSILLTISAVQLKNIANELENLKYIDNAVLFIKSFENAEPLFKWLRDKDREFLFLIISITKETTSFYHHEIACVLRKDFSERKKSITQNLKTLKNNIADNNSYVSKNFRTINDLLIKYI